MIQVLRSFTTVGFIGKIPGAPGTYASLATLPVAFLWGSLVNENHLLTLGLIIVISILGTLASSIVARDMGVEDPSEIVIDEVAGQWLAVLALPFNWWLWLAAFILFRVFDIWKPWIINNSQNLPGGLGIMMDDILAGLLTFLLVQGVAAFL
ncbi:MAG: phosphatidylglycerophosphatase A [Candidatus Marinimicrobia bacterium]|nr:phosphatidylglycerophosphatase A [Candidatus Neomarinimicrobiota bacterium]MCF7850987.1 phosphatidylglycerophosphatase A [Candidatus Neomarinimicrobiota bacterium]MCF7905544.1 phosphatidylglycerophosphatase A [Candidatus Neomarinimicrobiota bacterium]